MRDVPIPEDSIHDPLARNVHPKLGRDPERTPMQWEPGPGAGFTTGTPWLPIAADADARNVLRQRDDPSSLLSLYRDLIALRRRTPALHRGSYRALESPPGVLAYERVAPGSRAVVALNFGTEPRTLRRGEGVVQGGLRTSANVPLPDAEELDLGPSEGLVLVLG
jgi:alpha-glucosidase